MRWITRHKIATAAAVAAGVVLAGCGSSAPAQPKLSAKVVCQRYDQQVQWMTFLQNPSPTDIAKMDGYISSDASRSASPALTAALRAMHGRLGEVIATGADPVDFEARVSRICSAYPTTG